MRLELIDAVNALNERKSASGIGFAAEGEGGWSGDHRGLTVGMDLNMDEAAFVSHQLADQTLEFIEKSGVELRVVLAGVWVDGLMAGLVLSEQRARKAAA